MAKSNPRYGQGTGKLHPVDVHVGTRVRLRRTLLGMTQTVLANALGLTFQQVQKYERGTNRISASRLYDLSRVLDMPVEYFFEDMPPPVTTSSPAIGRGRAIEPARCKPDPMVKRETLEFVRAYYKIRDPRNRKRLFEFTKALGADAGKDS